MDMSLIRELEDLRDRVQDLERELRMLLSLVGGGGGGGGGNFTIDTVTVLPAIPTEKARVVFLDVEHPNARQKWGANPGDERWKPLEVTVYTGWGGAGSGSPGYPN